MTEETETTDLVVRETQALAYSMPGPTEWKLMRQQAEVFVRSGLLPKQVNTPEKAIALMLKGRELNVPPWTALTKIHVITGEPTVSPALMLAMVRRSGKLESFEIVERTAEQCTIKGKRVGEPMHIETFTIEEAGRLTTKQYGKEIPLTEKRNWQEQPEVMLMWRCVSRFCRLIFGDIIDLYIHEEINPDLRFDDMGEIVEAEEYEYEQAHPDLQDEMDGIVNPIEPAMQSGKHWIEIPAVRKRYWQYVKNELGLTEDEAHEALGVEKTKDFAGSRKEASQLLEIYAGKKYGREAREAYENATDGALQDELVPYLRTDTIPSTFLSAIKKLQDHFWANGEQVMFAPQEVDNRLQLEGHPNLRPEWDGTNSDAWVILQCVYAQMVNEAPLFKDV